MGKNFFLYLFVMFQYFLDLQYFKNLNKGNNSELLENLSETIFDNIICDYKKLKKEILKNISIIIFKEFT